MIVSELQSLREPRMFTFLYSVRPVTLDIIPYLSPDNSSSS